MGTFTAGEGSVGRCQYQSGFLVFGPGFFGSLNIKLCVLFFENMRLKVEKRSTKVQSTKIKLLGAQTRDQNKIDYWVPAVLRATENVISVLRLRDLPFKVALVASGFAAPMPLA